MRTRSSATPAMRSPPPVLPDTPMHDDELKQAIRERAVLKGNFVLRSGQRALLLHRQVPLRNRARAARATGRVSRRRSRASTPSHRATGRSRDRRSAARGGGVDVLEAALPHRPQGGEGVRDGKSCRGRVLPGERVCLLEDVVTTGGAAVDAVHALREAGLECANAVCIVDRESGGQTPSPGSQCGCGRCSGRQILSKLEVPAKPAWLSGSDPAVTLLGT